MGPSRVLLLSRAHSQRVLTYLICGFNTRRKRRLRVEQGIRKQKRWASLQLLFRTYIRAPAHAFPNLAGLRRKIYREFIQVRHHGNRIQHYKFGIFSDCPKASRWASAETNWSHSARLFFTSTRYRNMVLATPLRRNVSTQHIHSKNIHIQPK